MNDISATDRVVRNTAPKINDRLANELRGRLAYYRQHPEQIEARLSEINDEWDIERVLETNASALAFTGVALGATVGRRYLWLPAVVTAFLFQHALQGWCPPLPVFRRMGYRTSREIEHERKLLEQLQASNEEGDRPATTRD